MKYNFTEQDLAKCPFCGKEYVEVEKKIVETICTRNCYGEYRQEWEARWNVRCVNPLCEVQPCTKDHASLAEAVEVWNHRS